MTDYTKLIERLANYKRWDRPAIVWEAVDAIEALQGENGQLHASLQSARVAFEQVCKHRDALSAKLNELQRQEPEGWKTPEFWMNSVVTNPDCQVKDNLPHQDNCRWWRSGDFCNCGAAPKALEPLTEQRLADIWKSVFQAHVPGVAFDLELIRAVEAAHGITKGAPC